MNAPVAQVAFTFVDKESNKGTMTLYCSFSLTGAALLSLLNTLASLLQPLSNAALMNVTVTYKVFLEPYSTGLGIPDLTSRVLLLYSEGDTYEAISIPAPKETLFETEGEYAGVRVDPLSVDMAAWFASWSDFSSHITTKEGDPFPSTFLVGGKSL